MRRVHLSETDSTNAHAERLLRQGAAAPLLVSATRQTAGRGRDGREWHSPPGGAWMTAAVAVRGEAEAYQAFPLVVGLAAHDAISATLSGFGHRLSDADLRIKWPNDLLLFGRKVCGVLCQTVVDGGRITHLLAGVGINVTFDPESLGVPLRHPPTCLARHFPASDTWVEALVEAFAESLRVRAGQFERGVLGRARAGGTDDALGEGLHEAISQRLACVGAGTTWTVAGETSGAGSGQTLSGVLRGIDRRGRLLLATETGVVALDSGELVSSTFADAASPAAFSSVQSSASEQSSSSNKRFVS